MSEVRQDPHLSRILNLPEPNYTRGNLARWETSHGLVVSHKGEVFLHPKNFEKSEVANSEELALALLAAGAWREQ